MSTDPATLGSDCRRLQLCSWHARTFCMLLSSVLQCRVAVLKAIGHCCGWHAACGSMCRHGLLWVYTRAHDLLDALANSTCRHLQGSCSRQCNPCQRAISGCSNGQTKHADVQTWQLQRTPAAITVDRSSRALAQPNCFQINHADAHTRSHQHKSPIANTRALWLLWLCMAPAGASHKAKTMHGVHHTAAPNHIPDPSSHLLSFSGLSTGAAGSAAGASCMPAYVLSSTTYASACSKIDRHHLRLELGALEGL